MQSFIRDFRLALRTLSKNPGFTLVALLTLALGIGANTAVFSVIHAVLLKPLPYEQPEQLTLIWTNFGPDLPQNWVSGPEFVEMREFNTTFEDIGVVVPFTVSVTGDGDPEQVGAAAASADFFNILRVRPAAGRLFVPGDDAPGAGLVVVLSYGFWQQRYGGDPAVMGRKIQVEGLPFQVVGVLPPGFAVMHPDAQFPSSVEIWAPVTSTFGRFFGVDEYSRMPRGSHGLRGFGRLKPGVTIEQAQSDMTAVAARMQEKSPDYYDFEGWGITVLSLHDDLVEEYRPALMVLMTAVGLVLLIACVNVANLMLARAASREREIALRRALGAGRGQLVRQVLTESVTLSAIGGLAGLALAFLLVRAVDAFAPAGLPRSGEIAINGQVLLFTLGVALATGLLFGLAPVFYGLRENLSESLKEGARGSSMGPGGRRFRSLLVVCEVALALVLLVGAGLMIRTFSNLLRSDPGYRSENIMTLRVSLPQSKYSTGEQVNGFFDRLFERVNALPGVRSSGAISHLPLAGGAMSGTTRVEESATLPQDQLAGEVDRRVVTPGYFKTMGIRVIQGRAFTAQDRADSPPVAVVDEQFVKRFWPTEEPIGKRISIRSNEEGRIWHEVVGVVAHSKHANLNRAGREQAYFPLRQFPFNNMYLAVQTTANPLQIASALRNQVLALDPDQPVSDVATMQARVDAALSQPRFNLLLFGAFAVTALLLAAVGIYGVISYSVNQRSSEIGVRMALGADAVAVRMLVLRQGLLLVLAALAAGVGAALFFSSLMSSFLYDVAPTDPLTYVLVAGLLALVAAAACYLPAARASRLDPVEVLHGE